MDIHIYVDKIHIHIQYLILDMDMDKSIMDNHEFIHGWTISISNWILILDMDMDRSIMDNHGFIHGWTISISNWIFAIPRLGSKCPNCVRFACNKPHCKTLGMFSINLEDKIKFVKDGMSKESFADILRSLETHPSEYVQCEIHNL